MIRRSAFNFFETLISSATGNNNGASGMFQCFLVVEN